MSLCSDNPSQYLKSPNSVFSFNEIDIGKVSYRRLLNQINTKRSPGLDNFPGNLLKIAADNLAPSLTKIFNKFLSTSIYPMIGSWPELFLYLKVAIGQI